MQTTQRLWLLACAALGLALIPTVGLAQSETGDDFGLWTSIGAQKGFGKQWNVGAEVEYRLRSDWSEAERYTFGLGAAYKPLKWLKVDAGYKLIRFQTEDAYTYKKSNPSLVNKWTPPYWGTKHRVYASVGASWRLDRWTLSLRERWQYSYRPEQTVDRYDVDGQGLENVTDTDLEQKVKRGKAKHVLRSRLLAEYKLPKRTGLTPYAAVEMYTAKGLDKMRYTIGTEWKLNKHHAFDLGYRYQDLNDDDDSERNTHAILVGYKFKF